MRIRSWFRASLAVLVAGLKLVTYSLTSVHLVGFVAFLACAAPARAQSLTFTHFAGSLGGADSIDASGSAARFHGPSGVAVDASGNVYVADTGNHTIRMITAAGVVTTLAGTAGSSGSADGTGSAARFYYPRGVAVDASGNVYVADTNNHTIRKITPAGVVTTLAGTALSPGSADGTGSAALFYEPHGVAVDGSGNIYVADTGNNTIRKIAPAGVVTTLAGTAGSYGSADGTGSAAQFYSPSGVAVDGSGNVYVADTGNATIRKITPTGVVTTLAGTARAWGSADGTGSAARFDGPGGVAVDGSGNVYVADNFGCTIRKITPAGVVTTLAGTAGSPGSADGTGSAARFYQPPGVAVDGSGNVYVADTYNGTIRKITPAGVVTTLAGTAGSSGSADGTGSAALFRQPWGVAVDGSGNVYVADLSNQTIRKIAPAGVVTTLAGTAGSSGSADGTGSAARFNYPSGVAVDGSGNVYVADNYNHTIRKVTPAGVVTTLAGTAGSYGSADGTGSAARFYIPCGVAVDGSGNVYVADTYNHTIRKVTPAGVVTTLAGTAGSYGSADGTGSAARFRSPQGVAVDASGNVYVADSDNHAIRKSVPALEDAASIDAASGAIGTARVLGTAPRTATAWEWALIRRPSGSTAVLSSTSVENPTFTPDVGDLFVFRLTASSSAGARISTVSLNAIDVPLPTITSISPNAGPATGGQSVTITGTNLSGAAVTFGGIAATVTGTTATTVAFTTPAHAAGAVDVTVTTEGGSATAAGGYCVISISPVNASTAAAGGTGSFTVATGASCAWTARSLAPWITVTGGATGTGSGTVTYSVAANTTTTRIGKISVGGVLFKVTQDANTASGGGPVAAALTAIFATGSTSDMSNDANGDCQVTPIDVFWLINAIFANGEPIETCPVPQ